MKKEKSSASSSTSKKKLKIEEVFSSSDEEDLSPKTPKDLVKCVPVDVSSIVKNSFVVVSVKSNKKNKKPINFVAVVQTEVDEEFELKVMFMKNFCSDKSVYIMDEKDVSYVFCDQIVGVLPSPSVVAEGGKIVYKFKNLVQL